MKRIFILILFIFMSVLVACDDNIPSVQKPNENILPNNTQIDVNLYKDAGNNNEFGFSYGDYVVKGTTYIGGIMNVYCEELSNNILAQGKILHYYENDIYEYTLFNEVLENKDQVFAFSIVNHMNVEDLVTCIGVKEKNTENTDIYDFLLFVDKYGNLYRGWCNIREEYIFNVFFMRWIELLEPVNGYVAGSSIVTNDEFDKIDKLEFLDLLPLIRKDVFIDIDSYTKSELYHKIASKKCFSLSGFFHQWYRVGENYILNIYKDNIYDNVVCELIYYEDGLAEFTCKDINKFEQFINAENCKKYLGMHYNNEEENAVIKMTEEGPYIEISYIDESKQVLKAKGQCNVIDDTLIVYENYGELVRVLYFDILEKESIVVFKFNKEIKN